MGCIIGYLLKVCICIGTVNDEICLVLSCVEAGYAVCINTWRILRLVRTDYPRKLLGYFIYTVDPSNWWNRCLKSAFRPTCTISFRPMIISWPMSDSPLLILTWKLWLIILLLENYGMQKKHLDVMCCAVHTSDCTILQFIIPHLVYILLSVFYF